MSASTPAQLTLTTASCPPPPGASRPCPPDGDGCLLRRLRSGSL